MNIAFDVIYLFNKPLLPLPLSIHHSIVRLIASQWLFMHNGWKLFIAALTILIQTLDLICLIASHKKLDQNFGLYIIFVYVALVFESECIIGNILSKKFQNQPTVDASKVRGVEAQT